MADHHGRGPVDVAVVGGGIVGCAIAREAARAGARVLLFERAALPVRTLDPGFVTAQCDAESADPFFDLRMRGRAAMPAFLEGLTSETGLAVAQRAAGLLLPAADLAELEALHARAAWQRRAGLPFESLTGGTAHEREPGLADDLVAALHLPEERGLDAAGLHNALLHGCAEAGVEVHLATPVLGVARVAGVVTGLHIPEGSVAAGAVVLAAGAHCGVGGLPSAPVEPRRITVATLGQSRGMRHGLWHPRVRVAPLPDGRLLLASPPERVGFDDRVSASRLGELLSAATRIAPGLGELPVTGVGATLVATTSDTMPLLGSTDAVNLLYATGFGEHALTVAPAVALLLVEYLQSGQAAMDLSPFSPLRFVS
jgi:glycine oxidase